MKKSSIVLLVLLALVVIIGYTGCNIQKTLVAQDEAVKKEWGDVQNQYQRRSDLIPNLVATVKGAANFEKGTLEAVINARAKATSMNINADDLTPEKLAQFQQAQGQLSQALGKLMVITEAYPELKANQNFLSLQDQIEGTENRINTARGKFNASVQTYNTTVRQVPNNFFAGMMGFQPRPSFAADPAAQNAPAVHF